MRKGKKFLFKKFERVSLEHKHTGGVLVPTDPQDAFITAVVNDTCFWYVLSFKSNRTQKRRTSSDAVVAF